VLVSKQTADLATSVTQEAAPELTGEAVQASQTVASTAADTGMLDELAQMIVKLRPMVREAISEVFGSETRKCRKPHRRIGSGAYGKRLLVDDRHGVAVRERFDRHRERRVLTERRKSARAVRREFTDGVFALGDHRPTVVDIRLSSFVHHVAHCVTCPRRFVVELSSVVSDEHHEPLHQR
jgi:hypothetical protein